MLAGMHPWDPVCPKVPVVHPVSIDPEGITGPTRHEVRRGWRRSSRGLLVPSTVESGTPEQRIVEQAARLPAGGAVTGWAGCRLHRVGLVDGLARDGRTRLPVPLLVGRGGRIRGDDQVHLLHTSVPAWEITHQYGVPVAHLARCAFDAARTAEDLREAVVALDMVLATRLVSPQRIAAYTRSHRRERGASQVVRALELCSEQSRSPNETRVRLVWILDAGLSPDVLLNRSVFGSRGELIGIADLLDRHVGLAVEVDGADHRKAVRHAKDVRKQEALLDHDLEVCRVTGPDLFVDGLAGERLGKAHARAAARPQRSRRWRLGDPPVPIEEELRDGESKALFYSALEDEQLPDVSGW